MRETEREALPPPGPEAARLLQEYQATLEAGRTPDRGPFLAAHPELADCLDALDFVHGALSQLRTEPGGDAPGTLGDFRIVREIARGGMGVVYEAEQISLGRRVALKVLPFAAVLDPKQLQRFKNEAMAAAHLHHPHIVPVHAVGCERGVHYYAMQLIEGQSLSLAIRDIRGGGAGEGAKTPISSHGSNREPGYLRMAAAIGAQAAEALDHAHQLGIVHRDVKPGNLLVDEGGTLFITDFGLASSVADVGVTRTGELLGTIRYMSPEQALAKRVPIDHRTDVYSLGATLYELFTLEPAFPGDDPHRVIQDIAFKDPTPPRRLNPALPTDLETLLLKAMCKDPAGRYATAQDMADDLRRYLEDQPVLARRPSLAARAARWSRRHRGLVAASLGFLILGVAALVTDHFRVAREQRRTKTALATAYGNLDLARRAVDRFLVEVGIDNHEEQPLPSPARQELLKDALKFYATCPEDHTSLGKRVNILHAMHDYEGALALLDRLPRDVLVLTERGHMLWHLKRHGEALASLDRGIENDPRAAGAHLYRGLVLRALGRSNEAAAAYREAIGLKPDDYVAHDNLGVVLTAEGNLDGAIEEHREATRLRPNFAMAHYNLAGAFHAKGDRDGAIEEYREAIRLEPEFAEAYVNLGTALAANGDPDGAIREYRWAIRMRPDLGQAHANLGNALATKGDVARAVEAYREAVRLMPDDADAHYALGIGLRSTGDLGGAIEEFRDAVRIRQDFAEAHCDLGHALSIQGRFREAVSSYRRGHEVGSKRSDWVYPTGMWIESAERVARLEEAVDALLSGEAQPRDALERTAFGVLLYARAHHAEAARQYEKAFAEDPALAEDLKSDHRYNAACCAALAAARGGKDAAEWRGRALRWLRVDLAARERAEMRVGHWKEDPDLAVVRSRLSDLPAPEREEWTRLWADVDALLAKARER